MRHQCGHSLGVIFMVKIGSSCLAALLSLIVM